MLPEKESMITADFPARWCSMDDHCEILINSLFTSFLQSQPISKAVSTLTLEKIPALLTSTNKQNF